jgi:glutathione S-transferase
VRTALFSVWIDEPDNLCATFSLPKPALVRWLYRAAFPLAKGMIAKGNGVTDPANVARSFEITREALDFVAKESAATGRLAGPAFSVADLACAALLAPLVDVPHPDMAKLRPLPERIEAFLARWASHPGAQWVLAQYAQHRPPSCALD